MSRASNARHARRDRQRRRGWKWRVVPSAMFTIPAGSFVDVGEMEFSGFVEELTDQICASLKMPIHIATMKFTPEFVEAGLRECDGHFEFRENGDVRWVPHVVTP